MQNVFWAYKDQTVVINYKLRLLQNILIRIYINYNKLLSTTFGDLKVTAQNAKNFLCIQNRLFPKIIKFEQRNQILINNIGKRASVNTQNNKNISKRKSEFSDIFADRRKKAFNDGIYFYYKKKGYRAKEYLIKPKNNNSF